MEKVFEIYIKTTPERLWQAITDPDDPRASTTSAPRRRRTGRPARGSRWAQPERAGARSARARTSRSTRRAGSCRAMVALWGEDVKSEGTSRVTWEIEPVGDSCRLIVTHDQLREGANDQLYGGWPMILSGLKTLARDRRAADHARLADVQPAPAGSDPPAIRTLRRTRTGGSTWPDRPNEPRSGAGNDRDPGQRPGPGARVLRRHARLREADGRPYGQGQRWLEVGPAGAATTIALMAAAAGQPPGSTPRFGSRATMRGPITPTCVARGVDIDPDVLPYPSRCSRSAISTETV